MTYKDTNGPMYTRMMSFGRVRGFVFGSWGEVSQDVKSFVKLVAETSAAKIWRNIDKARSIEEVQGVIKHRLRRILGITAVRSAHFLKLNRISHLTGDFQRSRTRSRRARSFYQAWNSEYDTFFGPRTWRAPRT